MYKIFAILLVAVAAGGVSGSTKPVNEVSRALVYINAQVKMLADFPPLVSLFSYSEGGGAVCLLCHSPEYASGEASYSSFLNVEPTS